MTIQLETFDKVNNFISNNDNDSFEKTTNLNSKLKNNNSSIDSPSNNFNPIGQNESFCLLNELNIGSSFDIKLNAPGSNNKSKDNKNKIFNIEKSVKLGRLTKSSLRKGTHNRFKKDNLIRKFKVHLIKNIFNFINSCFLINQNVKTKNFIKVIKKLSSFNIKLISKEDNLKWLNTKLRYIFSQNITAKCTNYDTNYNENLIKRIYEKKEEKKVIFLLEKTVKEMWHIYVYGSIDKNYYGFKTLKDDLNTMKELGETDKYINEYKNVAVHFENIFNLKIGRKKKN